MSETFEADRRRADLAWESVLRAGGAKRPPRKRRLKLRIAAEQRFRCFYCGVELCMNFFPPDTDPCPRGATLDHIVPRSKGGGHGPSNLVVACFRCNSAKGDLLFVEGVTKADLRAAFGRG